MEPSKTAVPVGPVLQAGKARLPAGLRARGPEENGCALLKVECASPVFLAARHQGRRTNSGIAAWGRSNDDGLKVALAGVGMRHRCTE